MADSVCAGRVLLVAGGLPYMRKKLITLPLLPLLHPLSTDEAYRHTGVAALRGHTGHTITNGVVGSVGVSHFFVFFSFFP